jgi:membrane protease YdiL (CAAX protease family)
MIVILYLIIFRFLLLHLLFPLAQNSFSAAGFSALRVLCLLCVFLLMSASAVKTLYQSYVSVSDHPAETCRKTVICLLALIAVQLAGAFLRILTHGDPGSSAAFNTSFFKSDPLGMALTSVIFMPVMEELVFRYSLYELARTRMQHTPAMVSVSILFAMMHTVPGSAGTCIASGVYMLCGICLQMLYTHTSLIPCVIAHAVFNLLALLV